MLIALESHLARSEKHDLTIDLLLAIEPTGFGFDGKRKTHLRVQEGDARVLKVLQTSNEKQYYGFTTNHGGIKIMVNNGHQSICKSLFPPSIRCNHMAAWELFTCSIMGNLKLIGKDDKGEAEEFSPFAPIRERTGVFHMTFDYDKREEICGVWFSKSHLL